MTSMLENAALRLMFDHEAGGVTAITNKLAGETYAVAGDAFAVETAAFRRSQTEMRQIEWTVTEDAVTARYADADLTVEIAYELRPSDHFFQKRMAVTFTGGGWVTQITLSHLTISLISGSANDCRKKAQETQETQQDKARGGCTCLDQAEGSVISCHSASSAPLGGSTVSVGLPGLDVVCYRHPDFDWVSDYVKAKHGWDMRRPENSEPARTYFGRTAKGGFFSGVEMAYDNSRQEGQTLILSYAPSLKVKAGERLECEVMYFGVYRGDGRDARAAEWKPISATAVVGRDAQSGFNGAAATGLGAQSGSAGTATDPARVKAVPLPSESAAMVAMTAAILGPPRHGLMAFACGWHCQMEQEAYDSDEKLEDELRSLEFCAACGLDGMSDSHPWGGESHKMAALRAGERHKLDARVRRFLDRARELELEVAQWPTMNNTHPWRTYGGPFRLDKPEWLRGIDGAALGGANADNFRRREANCFACEPFYEWLETVILDDVLGTGLYDGWCMDGDFWGTGAYFHSTLPVTCQAAHHEHLPGDANYACQRRLDRMIAEVRRRYPDMYITMCRPPMDLGVWALRHVDACFTLIESGTGGSNLAAGDEVRTASRIRVHHHFFPHWLDWSLLFPSYAGEPYPQWPRGHIDYLMLSALSCSPNLLLYLPTKTGIPDEDQAEIRRWLDWGRANVQYLLVRHDLFDWPGKGVVDGSAHLLGDHGLIFLFNSSPNEKVVAFALTPESTGYTGTVPVQIVQEHPPCGRREIVQPGAAVRWPVPPETAVVLRLTTQPGQAGN